jgi:ornithine cyclodeaminase
VLEFRVTGGKAVREIVDRLRPQIVETVRETYLAHESGASVNPDSYFLRFPDKPDSRIIALPAYLGGERDTVGIKWIASFPGNIVRGLPRASAVLLLNDYQTGYPYAMLEASQISAARTAASAALAAEVLSGGRAATRLVVVGAGIIARNVLEFLAAQDWSIDCVAVHDREPRYAEALAGYASTELGYRATTVPHPTADLRASDVVLLATTAGEPHIVDPATFAPGQLVLNISLRDLGPEIIAGAANVLDDVEHCLKADTSPHLAEQRYGHRDFITGTLAQVVNGDVAVAPDRPVVFSPFGLGVLDLAVGDLVHREACASGRAITIPDFFGETTRW